MALTPRQKTRATGARYQDWICDWLEKKGWITHNQKTVSKQIKVRDKNTGGLRDIWVSARQDLFGIFDIIAKKDGVTLWIQATAHKSLKEKVDKINAPKLTYSSSEYPMVWMKRDTYNHDLYIIKDGESSHLGKIIKRAFFVAQGMEQTFVQIEGVQWDF